jgi:antitoxin VapB
MRIYEGFDVIRTRTFKSGNSVALRLPKALGIKEGVDMRVREEQGRYIVEPVAQAGSKIDLTGIAGSVPGIERLPFEEKARDWGSQASRRG